MTRKDFVLIAEALKIARGMFDGNHAASTTLDVLAQEFAHKLARTNPRFDRARFLAACGVS